MTREARVRDHASQCAFELAHVRTNALRDEERDFFRQPRTRGLCLRDENRDARLQLRRLDRLRKAPAEAGFQPILEPVDFFRITVAREDDLMLTFEELVERVEELFLRARLVREELDVI